MNEPPHLPFGAPSSPQRAGRHIVTVTALTAQIRTALESTYSEVWVEGELTNSRLWKTGHLYFTLRDEQAQIKAVMFRSAVRNLRFKPEDGLKVVARGRISVYEPKGEYQIVCEHLQPQGVGALQVAFDQLKRSLEADGLFAPERKRPLPLLPRQIGIVTSLDGAALRDILNVLARRHPTAHVLVYATRVQGDGAAETIARGIGLLSRTPGVDVIIAGRGGGSLEDLWAFNEEPVARAIAAATVPVISAVGHETDVTLSDLVADVRAPTPSAAAEIVVSRRQELQNRIQELTRALRRSLTDRIGRQRTRLFELNRRPGLAAWPARLAGHGRHAAELTHALSSAGLVIPISRQRHLRATRARLEAHEPGRRLESTRTRVVTAQERLRAGMTHQRQELTGGLRDLAGRLDALSPLGVLSRGYAVCWNEDRTTILRDSDHVSTGDHVAVTLRHGELTCTVITKK